MNGIVKTLFYRVFRIFDNHLLVVMRN